MAFGQKGAAVLHDAPGGGVDVAHLVGGVDVGGDAAGDVVAHLERALGTAPVEIGAAEGLELAPVLLAQVLLVEERDAAPVAHVAHLQRAAAEVAQLVRPQVLRPQATRVARLALRNEFQLLFAVAQRVPDGSERSPFLQVAVVPRYEDRLDPQRRIL